ncbi:unnamed protein product [Thelazia callipaeda]|uniref:BLOC-1-related complex subunit 5 n=1 Tax=Thelazia callipaeda TaxID=103827 RepID=A0A0N5CM23_THECL|nr:unnamed protein product [Thelazia callipaeda]
MEVNSGNSSVISCNNKRSGSDSQRRQNGENASNTREHSSIQIGQLSNGWERFLKNLPHHRRLSESEQSELMLPQIRNMFGAEKVMCQHYKERMKTTDHLATRCEKMLFLERRDHSR